MGTVHDLLEAKGKQGALMLADRCVVEAASNYMADEDSSVGYLFSGWTQAAVILHASKPPVATRLFAVR